MHFDNHTILRSGNVVARTVKTDLGSAQFTPSENYSVQRRSMCKISSVLQTPIDPESSHLSPQEVSQGSDLLEEKLSASTQMKVKRRSGSKCSLPVENVTVNKFATKCPKKPRNGASKYLKVPFFISMA
jgi:hypothetical protein